MDVLNVDLVFIIVLVVVLMAVVVINIGGGHCGVHLYALVMTVVVLMMVF